MNEELQEFWEWCGFSSFPSQEQRYVSYPSRSLRSRYKTRDVLEYVPVTKWIYPEGHSMSSLPTLDPNNLFKYAVPKLFELGMKFNLSSYGETYVFRIFREQFDCVAAVEDEDPAQAIYQAIQKARGVKE